MGIDVVSLTCPVCGAPFSPNEEKCSFCGSILVLRTNHPRINPASLNKQVIDKHIADFRQTLRRDPYDAAAHYGLGVAYFNLGLTDDSVRELEDAARLMPENPSIQSQLAVVLRKAELENRPGASPKLRDRIEYTLRLDPDNVDATLLKIETSDKLTDQETLELLETTYKREPHQTKDRFVNALINIAGTRKYARSEKGIDLLRQAHEIDPDMAKTPLTDALLGYAKYLSASNPGWDVIEPTRATKAIHAWKDLQRFNGLLALNELSKTILSSPNVDKAILKKANSVVTSGASKPGSEVSRKRKRSKGSQGSTTKAGYIKAIIVALLKAIGIWLLLFVATLVIFNDESGPPVILIAVVLILLVALPIFLPILEIRKVQKRSREIVMDRQLQAYRGPQSASTTEDQKRFNELLAILKLHFNDRWIRESVQRITADTSNSGTKGERERTRLFKDAIAR